MENDLCSQIQDLQDSFNQTLNSIPLDQWNSRCLTEWSQEWLGKKGVFSPIEETFQKLSKDEKKSLGKMFYEKKNTYLSFVQSKLSEKEHQWENWRLQNESIDLTLPHSTSESFRASFHPVFVVQERVCETLKSLGFVVCDSPEVEHDDYNFRLLNFPDGHSARDMQDSFLLEKDWYLRTHTSNGQIHALRKFGTPLALASPGRVYRAEADATHLPMFHQIECLMVDQGIHMGHMRYTIESFISKLFDLKLKTRFRPSYFPFTEPSAEFDMQCYQCLGKGCRLCKQTGWIEIGGCGQVHRQVLKQSFVDDSFTGFAFGFGLERLAMMLFQIQDLRDLYRGDISYINSFRLWSLS
jgi:phenylalanyl-tRNA synthetase alpha chain